MLVLIDGHYYAYRYFFGMPALSGPDGRPTGVTKAFAELFRNLRERGDVSHWALVFDPATPTFRHEFYPEYKANRDPMPDLLRPQVLDVEHLARLNGIPVVRIDRFEADDVIANLARRACLTQDVRICSKDKDLDQVLGERVKTWDVGRDEVRGPEELQAEKGITPAQVIDYLCMIGDSSDNVPGIKGVGPKTAVKLLQRFGSLDEILAHAEELKGKQRENILEFRQRVDLVRHLITIPDDVPGLPEISDLALTDIPDTTALRDFLQELKFNASRFLPKVTNYASQGAHYRTLAAADLPAFLDHLRNAGRCAVDTETTGLDPVADNLVGISFACGDGPEGKDAAYLPLAGVGETVSWNEVEPQLRTFLEDPSVGKVMQNAKFDLRMFLARGIRVAGLDGDPMLASWLLDPGHLERENRDESRPQGDGRSLDEMARQFLGEEKIPTSAVVNVAEQTMAEVAVATVARYACEDAQCTWRLARLLEERLAQHGLLGAYREQELPLAVCLAEIEQTGMIVERSVLAEKQAHLEAYKSQVLVDIHAITGPDFNPGSPKQVGHWLFDRLGLPPVRFTGTKDRDGRKVPSTDAAVLAILRHHHELPDLIHQYRILDKLLGTYVRSLPDHISKITGRIHTNLKQTGTETGRLSSQGPNLQNIPKKSDLGRELRSAFVAAPGHCFLAADYSQIELRVLAHFSRDPALLQAFAEGADIHRRVAAEVNGVSEELVDPAMRNAAKAINFGLIYGQTPFGLAQQLGITQARAKKFIDSYFARFSHVREYFGRVITEATARGWVETLAGRRRYVPGLGSGNRNLQKAGERVALNSTIQGSAADIIKRAMLRCREMLPEGARLVLQIHDELIVESPEERADEAAVALASAMQGAAELAVPLTTEVHRGRDWFAVS